MDFLYFLKEDGCDHFKIGVTSDSPASRLTSLQSGNPRILKLFAYVECFSEKNAYTLETRIKNVWASNRMVGEWFSFSVEQASDIVKAYGGTFVDDFKQIKRKRPSIIPKSVIDVEVNFESWTRDVDGWKIAMMFISDSVKNGKGRNLSAVVARHFDVNQGQVSRALRQALAGNRITIPCKLLPNE